MSSSIELGAHLISPRVGYSHHGIYVGEGRVIHYAGLANGLEFGPVEETTISSFCAGNGYTVKEHTENTFPKTTIVERARSRIGENLYCVYSNNCEHFCIWCITGSHSSEQVNVGTSVAGSGAATGAGLLARAAVAAAGPVAGLSGAGAISGLATVGGVVGGGAVAGIALLGAAPGIAMASLVNNTVLADNPALDSDEREARSAGRAATYVGVAAGTVGSIAAVSATGSVAGLSAAGITSGLAAIGGTVGGGMAAGIAVTAAAPVAAAAAVGYCVYKIWQWVTDD